MALRFNGTQTIVDIAGSGGFTPILATGPTRFLRGTESQLTAAGAPNVPQGFEYQLVYPDGSVGQWIEIIPTDTMEIGDPQSLHGPAGSVIGNGPQTYGQGLPPTPATIICNLRAVTIAATSVMIQQDY